MCVFGLCAYVCLRTVPCLHVCVRLSCLSQHLASYYVVGWLCACQAIAYALFFYSHHTQNTHTHTHTHTHVHACAHSCRRARSSGRYVCKAWRTSASTRTPTRILQGCGRGCRPSSLLAARPADRLGGSSMQYVCITLCARAVCSLLGPSFRAVCTPTLKPTTLLVRLINHAARAPTPSLHPTYILLAASIFVCAQTPRRFRFGHTEALVQCGLPSRNATCCVAWILRVSVLHPHPRPRHPRCTKHEERPL